MKRALLTILLTLSFAPVAVSAQNFTTDDANNLKKWINNEDEFEEDDAKAILKYVDSRYEALLKNEANKKVALEVMNYIEDALTKAKKEKKDENWNGMAVWSIVGLSWIQALDVRHAQVSAENNHNTTVKK